MGRSAWTIVLDAKLVTESRIVIDIPLGWNNWLIELNHWLNHKTKKFDGINEWYQLILNEKRR